MNFDKVHIIFRIEMEKTASTNFISEILKSKNIDHVIFDNRVIAGEVSVTQTMALEASNKLQEQRGYLTFTWQMWLETPTALARGIEKGAAGDGNLGDTRGEGTKFIYGHLTK